MIVLDTNVLSEMMKDDPAPQVMAWVDTQVKVDIWITAVTAAELLAGAAVLPEGRRRTLLHQTIVQWIEVTLDERVLAFDLKSAHVYGSILETRKRQGRPITLADAQIAAIARSVGATLATRNTKDFVDIGIDLVNPWDESPATSGT
jgi:predicted nucleic acid-binding protein